MRGLALALLIGSTAVAVSISCSSGDGERVADGPNIVLVVTDDQTLSAFGPQTMPRTYRLLADGGTMFSDAILTTPLCCPSRATMLTGQYAHNHGVLSNKLGYGALQGKANVLPNWLQDAGYHTLHVGKFLHKYERVRPPEEVAPGWDEWYTTLETRSYYDYDLAVNGHIRHYGERPRDHVTRVLNRIASRLVREYAARAGSFYLQLDEFAPHFDNAGSRTVPCEGKRAVPAPGDLRAFADAPLPPSKAFNDRDVSDKPSFLRGLPRLTATQKRAELRSWRCALAATVEVDRGVARIQRELARAGELDDTAFLFVSDNGYSFGEHRAVRGKQLPYETLLRVPLGVRLPLSIRGHGQPPSLSVPVANIDLAPTIAELAGADPCRKGECRRMDGRSLVAPLRGETAGFADRALAIEYGRADERSFRGGTPCAYRGVRTPDEVFVEHTWIPKPQRGASCRRSEERELYDLRDDPDELHNLSGQGVAGERRLLRLTRRLSRCSGTEGRDAPDPGLPFCE